MNLARFTELVDQSADPLVLLEGRREIDGTMAAAATRFAAFLARRFPRLRFRSGNAPGSDLAFAAGVASVDASRLELVLPYTGHRRGQIPPGANTSSWDDATSAEARDAIVGATVDASPRARGMVVRWQDPRLGAKARYLLRDTMKVTGVPGALAKPCAALFVVDPADPGAGGTGHTIRVCRRQRVPVLLPDDWLGWETELC